MAAPSSPGRLSRFAVFLLLGGLVLVLAMLGYLNHVKETGSTKLTVSLGKHHPTPTSRASAKGAPATAPKAPLAPAKPAVDPAAIAGIMQTIADAMKVLNDPNNPGKAAALQALRETLRHADPQAAIAAIRQFLASGENAKTGLGFRVGEGGSLDEAPTMRTFLMDELGTISRDAGTLADAAAEARTTLAANTSPDENALAMRNLAWSDPNGSKATLAAAERAMLDNTAWRQAPTGGYLEAFDVAAYAGDASVFAELSDMAKTPSAVQKAALVAMERLSALSPGEVADYLNAHPDVLADRPLLRADYMGNVDLSNPDQLAQAEAYLQRPDVTEEEKEKFIGRLVTPAGFVSDNLLTPSTIPVSLPEHQALVNTVAQQWLASGKYPSLAAALQTAITSTGGGKP